MDYVQHFRVLCGLFINIVKFVLSFTRAGACSMLSLMAFSITNLTDDFCLVEHLETRIFQLFRFHGSMRSVRL